MHKVMWSVAGDAVIDSSSSSKRESSRSGSIRGVGTKGGRIGRTTTIVTAATPSRLDALEAQCRSWDGPLSVAVYLPVQASSPSASVPTTLSAAPALPSRAGGSNSSSPSQGRGSDISRAMGMVGRGYESLNEEAKRQLEKVVREAKGVFERWVGNFCPNHIIFLTSVHWTIVTNLNVGCSDRRLA